MSITPSALPPNDLVELGRIAAPHGVQGWVKVQAYSAGASVLRNATSWWLRAPRAAGGRSGWPPLFAIKVLALRLHGAGLVASLNGVGDRSRAESLKGFHICVSRAAFPAAGPDEYYWVDLIGCEVWGERGGAPAFIGGVVEVIDNGAHALLRVARPAEGGNDESRPAPGSKVVGARDVLVPFVEAHIQRVDLSARRIDSNWPADF